MNQRFADWRAWLRPTAATLLAGGLPLVGVLALGVWGTPWAGWIEEQPRALVVSVLVLIGTLGCAAALLPTHAVSLAWGFLLGAWVGPLMAWVTVVLAAAVGHRIGRAAAGRGLARRLASPPTDSQVRFDPGHASIARAAAWIALLRLSPLAPFAATNVGLAALGVGTRAMLVGTAVGMLPRVAIVAWLGAGMNRLDWSSPRSPLLLGLGIVTTIVLLALIGRVARKLMQCHAPPASPPTALTPEP